MIQDAGFVDRAMLMCLLADIPPNYNNVENKNAIIKSEITTHYIFHKDVANANLRKIRGYKIYKSIEKLKVV